MFIQIIDGEGNTLLAQTTNKNEQDVSLWLMANGFFIRKTKYLWLHCKRDHIAQINCDEETYFVSYDGGEKQSLPELWSIRELTFNAICKGHHTYTVSTNKFDVLTINL